MSVLDAVTLAISVLLAAYLLYALVRGERL
jgi:K+-transporting ATPase KdpF subunit